MSSTKRSQFPKTNQPSEQAEKFKQAARELGCDEDEAKFDAAVKRIASHKPASDKPTDPDQPKRKRDG